MQKQISQLHGICHLCDGACRIMTSIRLEDHAQKQNCQNGTDGTQCHQTKTVICRMPVTSNGRDTDSKCHDKRNRHRSSGDSAGVKCHREKTFRRKNCQKKDNRIEHNQQRGKGNCEKNTHQRNHKKNPYTDCYGHNQHHIRHRGNLFCQNLQIRFRYGDDESQHKPQYNHHP